jgi:SAM-dependent methyltransferase
MDMCDMGKVFSLPLFHAFFFIASFHHLENSLDRLRVLQDAKKILLPGGKIYMTNWNLLSPENERYVTSKTLEYPDGSADFTIKIGEYQRLYHAFSFAEYQKLAEEAGFTLEKCEFGERNSIVVFSR